MRGFFLNIDGIDYSGKSTHINYIRSWMELNRVPFISTREPGGTKLGEQLRDILLSNSTDIYNETELLLIFAARQQHLKEVILPALKDSKCVITDRFTTSTYAYQGFGKGLEFSKIGILEDWVQGDIRPDLNIIFDIPMELFEYRRGLSGVGCDRFESGDIRFFERVKEYYLSLVDEGNDRYVLIDSSRDIGVVQREIDNILYDRLKGKYLL